MWSLHPLLSNFMMWYWRSSFRIIISVILASGIQNLKADEGMWLPFKISEAQLRKMHEMGLNLPLDSLFSTQTSSLKDAIVSLDNGSCTGSFISNKGLLLTNHHCVIDDVQYQSSVTHNYLDNGFWASDRKAELPLPGKTASILVDVIDVTDSILSVIPADAEESRRTFLIDSMSTQIIGRLPLADHLHAELSQFYEGNQFFIFVSEVFEDVRLVASPPSSIGQFGDDEDNWMWPRHSADFSLLRVYSAPNGLPAAFSEKNIPYSPKKFLPIHLKDMEKDDFTMVLGYPGSTQRFLSSYGIRELEELVNPVVSEVRGIKQSIWETGMNANPALKIQYAAKMAESSNYWKYAIGQNLSIQSRRMIEKRSQLEQQFSNWLAENPDKDALYHQVLPHLAMIHTFKMSLVKTGVITMESLVTGPDLFMLALEALYFKTQLETNGSNQQAIAEANQEFRSAAVEILKNFDAALDKKVFIAMVDYYRNNLPDSLRVPDQELFGTKNTTDINHLANRIYSQSVLTDQSRLDQFLANPDPSVLSQDPALAFVGAVMSHYGRTFFIMEEIEAQTQGLMRQYIRGLMEMDSTHLFYPDANSTLRLSYGTIQDYHPRDGVRYKHFTTTKGLLQKINADPDNYQIPQQFATLLNQSDFRVYASKDGQMPVCFISNNDITGGNSGSPVINGDGALIGLAFDGNWEGMGSDLEYMEGLQMCVNVDIRYILFLLDKYAGLQWVLDELTINHHD